MSDSKWFDKQDMVETIDDPAVANFPQLAQNSIFRSLRKVTHSSYTRGELFMRLCAKLDKFFALKRASLCMLDESGENLEVVHIQVGREFKSGVRIKLAAEKTLLKRVLDKGKIYVRDFPQAINALEVEKKILIDEECCSLAIIPLIFGDKKIGTFNLASESYYAFNILESNLFDQFFTKTAEKIVELPD